MPCSSAPKATEQCRCPQTCPEPRCVGGCLACAAFAVLCDPPPPLCPTPSPQLVSTIFEVPAPDDDAHADAFLKDFLLNKRWVPAGEDSDG